MGLSSHPEAGYEKVAQARDLLTILDKLGFEEVALVTHEGHSRKCGPRLIAALEVSLLGSSLIIKYSKVEA